MGLTPGTRLGPYEIAAQIGAGGMGEVYRATDSKLRRDVAIKVLPEALSSDTGRLARFQREAEVLASLNHPGIAQIYGVEDTDGITALVMELVEGPTLADRLKDGPLTLDEASAIARQIADALDYAHEKGVVHRDLKPGNVKIRPDGVVKVLDFGLAKAGAARGAYSAEAPTVTAPQTEVGVVMGTAAYMAPEQAMGQQVDRRADIWAFGCVFYEMLTGTPPHRHDTSQETMASILRDAPDLSKVPAQAHRLLRRCLEKDPQKRLRHIGDVMALLDEPPSGSHSPPASTAVGIATGPASEASAGARPRWLWPVVLGAAVLAASAAVAFFVTRQDRSAPLESVRFEVGETDGMRFFYGGAMAVSPDGHWLVFPATGEDGVSRYWIRSLDTVEARAIPGSEGAYVPAAWTADSRSVIFTLLGDTKIRKSDIQGGPPLVLGDLPSFGLNGATSNKDVLLFAVAGAGGPLYRIPVAGGAVEPVTALGPGDTGHKFPQFLPDGRRFLYFRLSTDPNAAGIYVGSIDAAPEAQSNERLLASDRQAYYAPAVGGGLGHLLFMRGTTLMAQPFDPESLELRSTPVPATQNVDSFVPASYALFDVSASGTLVYRGGAGSGVSVGAFDDVGRLESSFGEAGVYRNPAVSPDGTRIAVARGAPGDIWILDTTRNTAQRLTFDAAEDTSPVWSPDGANIAFQSNRGGQPQIYLKPADGSREEVLLTDQPGTPTSWSRDGRYLLFQAVSDATGTDLWVLSNPGQPNPSASPVLATAFAEERGQISPDGRWLAYTSSESGTPAVFVRPFTPEERASGAKYLVSRGPGDYPRWSANGRQLFYVTPSLDLMVVDVDAGPAFQASTPRRQLSAPPPLLTIGWDLAADGRFVFVTASDGGKPAPFTVVLNWAASLPR